MSRWCLMPRAVPSTRKRKPAPVPGQLPPGMVEELGHNRLLRYITDYLEWMLIKAYSKDTVQSRCYHLRRFVRWADERGLSDPREITQPMLERYQRHLFYYRKQDGAPLSVAMQVQYLMPLKGWFKWMSREHHILANPAADLELPKTPRRLPRSVPTPQEVEAILAEAGHDTPHALRDRAMLETLYATGLRRMELIGVSVYDADLTRGLLWVRHGKGGRERMVPIGERAVAWLDKYMSQARPELLSNDSTTLFIDDRGEPMRPEWVSDKVKHYMEQAGVNKPGATHLLRHACATHMLEGGADIRFIQAMLGHANLQTTEIYTHVAIDKLVAVHKATHPSRLERHRDTQTPVTGPSLDETRETLLSAIADEREDEQADEAGDVAADAERRR